MEVCTQCHLETTSAPLPNAIRRFDRGPFSYRPGEPLSAFNSRSITRQGRAGKVSSRS